MNHIITEEVTVTYSVDVPGEAIDAFADQAAAQAMNDSEREEIYNELVEEYVCENQPPREKWVENIRERSIEVADAEEEPEEITDTMRLDFLEESRHCVLGMSDRTWEVGHGEGFKSVREGIDYLITTNKDMRK